MTDKDFLRDRLKKGYETGRNIVNVMMDRYEILWMIDLIERKEKPEKTQEYMNGYEAGMEQGYMRAMTDVVKIVKEMKWHGGGNKEKHAGEMFDDPAGRAADMQ